jgi:hypothetical protein
MKYCLLDWNALVNTVKQQTPPIQSLFKGKIGWGGRIRKLTGANQKPSKTVVFQCFQQFRLALP